MWFDGKNKEQEKKQKTAVAVAYEPGDAAPKILAAAEEGLVRPLITPSIAFAATQKIL